MEIVKISMDSLDKADRGDSWRTVVSKMIHKVEVSGASSQNFSAEISARRHENMSCGSFRSTPHRLCWGREQLGGAGAAGYLVSWQIEGEAQIEQGSRRVIQPAGSVAVVDARRAMSVTFPVQVRRIVANLPARMLEVRMPRLLTSHLEVFQPCGPFAATLFSYLTELSRESTTVLPGDVEALVENVSNLLKVTSGQATPGTCDSKELRRQALIRYLQQHACDTAVSLDAAAAHLNISRRLLQQMLQEMNTTFTQFIIEERLRSTAATLSRSKDVPISQIAYLSGFNDVSHFNHLFKRRFGVAPSEYRSSRQDMAVPE